jgi:predicted DNA-binding transcriptional regulator YafY
VVLEFSNKQGNYIKTFLCESQRIVEETNDTVLLEIYIHTTNDIIMELLKYGRNVKVVAPKSLVATMKERIAEMENLYK